MIRRRGQLQRVGVLLLCAAVIPSCGGNGSPAPAASSGGGGKPSVSQDGRFVVFETASSGGGSRVVIVDRVNDTSVVIDGTGLANAAVTPDGRFVAFDAVPDGGGPRQVFLKNQITGVTTLVSATPAGAAGGGDSSNPSVTDDGRFVAFQSTAVDVGARSASSSSILVREVATASIRSASSEATGNDINPSFSGNGQFVAFESRPLSGTGVSTVLLWNSENNQILTVSETPSHLPANGPSGAPSANLDGRFIAFASRATNLIEAASPAVAFAGESNIFVRDVLTGTMVVANVPVVPGIPADGDSIRPSISQDGTQVTFESTATNLTADAVVPGQSNIFVRDLSRETTTLVTQPPPTEPSPPTPPPAVPTTGGNVPVTGTGTPTGTTIPVVPTGTGTTTGTGTAVVPTGTGTATGLTTGTSVASTGTAAGTTPVVLPGNGTAGQTAGGALVTSAPVATTGSTSPFGATTPVVTPSAPVQTVAAIAFGSMRPRISPDGAFVVFESRGHALAGVGTSSGTRILIADLRSRRIAEIGGP